jgi:hypothetical protein
MGCSQKILLSTTQKMSLIILLEVGIHYNLYNKQKGRSTYYTGLFIENESLFTYFTLWLESKVYLIV